MQEIKVLIVEDEVLIAEDLKDLLLSFDVKAIEMAHSLESGIFMLKTFKPDIALLDIRMEGELDGLKIAEHINTNSNIPFIFITSHSDLETIRKIVQLKPAGYITKPFKRSDVFACINLVNTSTAKTRNKILIKDGHKTAVFEWDEIDYIEGEGNYINIYAGSRKVVARQSMDSIMNELDFETYYKIHRSYIINLKKVLKFTKKEVFIGSITIPVSRTLQEDFESRMSALN